MKMMQKRLSVPLSEQDVADLALLRSTPDAAKAAGIDDVDGSDASLVHALVRERLDRVMEYALSIGYEQLAQDEEWRARSAETRARRRGGSD